MFTVSSHVLLQNYVYSMLHTLYCTYSILYCIIFNFVYIIWPILFAVHIMNTLYSILYSVHTGWARTLWTNRKKLRFSLINLLISIVVALRLCTVE